MFECSRNYFILLYSLLVLLLTAINHKSITASAIPEQKTKPTFYSDPSNIHAIIVSSSRYWFNYRHAINALGIYEIFRRNGISDENIILSTSLERVPSFQELFVSSKLPLSKHRAFCLTLLANADLLFSPIQ